jgi:uncharacterized membrane protein
MDRLRHTDQLLQWAEQQHLSAEQLQLANKQQPLQPTPQQWLVLANHILLFGCVILISSALIFFFAHNWPLMHYLVKFALAASAVLASGMLAAFCPQPGRGQRVALFAAAILTGALLALIGQTYQTGADIWQLFAGWAALITPLVLLSKSRACYLLWFTLLELALWRHFAHHAWFWLFGPADMLLYLTLANLMLLLLSELALPRLGVLHAKPLAWLSAVALILPLSIGAMLGTWEENYQLNLVCYLLLGTVLALYYFRLARDVLIFALLLFSGIAVSTSALAQLLQFSDSFVGVNMLALYVIGSSAAAAVWLKHLLREQHR